MAKLVLPDIIGQFHGPYKGMFVCFVCVLIAGVSYVFVLPDCSSTESRILYTSTISIFYSSSSLFFSNKEPFLCCFFVSSIDRWLPGAGAAHRGRLSRHGLRSGQAAAAREEDPYPLSSKNCSLLWKMNDFYMDDLPIKILQWYGK